jgi:hypothetical protein
MKLWWSPFLLVSSVFTPAAQADVSGIYDEGKLAQEKSRLERRVKEIWKVIESNLTQKEKQALTNVRLEFPLIGANRHPIDFYADSNKQIVTLPILSLTFLEDLSAAYAWLWAKGQSLETIDEYNALLKYRKGREFKGKNYPPPLEALRIPAGPFADPKIEGLALRIRNSAFAFILAHELGHIYHRHPGYVEGVTRKEARSNEEAADLFALEMMRRTRTIPMGAILFFQATAYYLPNRGDYPDDKEGDKKWEAYLDNLATHPLTARRLQLIAKKLEETAEDFVSHEKTKAGRAASTDTIREVAKGANVIAKYLEDTELHHVMIKRVMEIDLSVWPQR